MREQRRWPNSAGISADEGGVGLACPGKAAFVFAPSGGILCRQIRRSAGFVSENEINLCGRCWASTGGWNVVAVSRKTKAAVPIAAKRRLAIHIRAKPRPLSSIAIYF